jgi:membrane protease subunit HflK
MHHAWPGISFPDIMPDSTRRPSSLPATLLLAEWLLVLVVAWVMKMMWLLPFAAVVTLIALLLLARPRLAVLKAAATLFAAYVLRDTDPSAPGVSAGVAVSFLVLGAALSFAGILASMNGRSEPPLSRCLIRLVVVLHFISAGVLLAAEYLQMPLQGWLMPAHASLAAIFIIDTLLRLMARLYAPVKQWDRLTPPGAFFFFAWLGREWRACLPDSSAEAADDSLMLNLADMWMWPVVRGGLPWLASAVLIITWGSSCLHEVPAGSQGVRQRLGAWETQALDPGLHASLPWPLGGVQIVDTSRVREVVLGFRTDPGQPILWERAHYEGEQQSLVGGGDDFLSISVPFHFRVGDPVRYLRQIAQPEELLAQEAQRVLLLLALPRGAAQIMTQAREEMRAEFRQRLQASLDTMESGITVTDVLLRDIHPPVSVAQAFQEVVSAMEDKEAAIHDAESNNIDSLFGARGFAAATLKNAESVVENRRAQTTGQTARFESRLAAWLLDPRLFQWREGFRVFDEALGSTKKAVVDDRLRAGMPAHLDLRKVLNPDIVSGAPPAPQALVPRPVKSLEAFDMEIEGFTKSGQGEIPAPNMAPPDADNLLQNPPASPKP